MIRFRVAESLIITALTTMLAFGLSACGVAASTILELGDPFFTMFIFNFNRIVLVTAITGVGLQAIGVANPALAYSTFPVIDRESMRLVILSRRPGLIGMTGGAVRKEQAQVVLRVRMADLAFLGCAFEDRSCIPLDMTLVTGNLNVGSGQLKISQGMIEYGLLPAFRRMASRAILAKLALMDIFVTMAAYAIFWSSLEHPLLMAIPTLDPYMTASKRESRLRMIEKCI